MLKPMGADSARTITQRTGLFPLTGDGVLKNGHVAPEAISFVLYAGEKKKNKTGNK